MKYFVFAQPDKKMVKGLTGVPADIRLESFPDPGNRFTLGDVIGTGVSGTVYEAIDTQAGKSHYHVLTNSEFPRSKNQ